MDGAARISTTEYQQLATRWRRLAADARQCEFLAGHVADVTAEIAAEELGAGRPDATP